jgi:hypothetical protein
MQYQPTPHFSFSIGWTFSLSDFSSLLCCGAMAENLSLEAPTAAMLFR